MMYTIKFGMQIPDNILMCQMNCDNADHVIATLDDLVKNNAVDISIFELVDVSEKFLNPNESKASTTK